MRISVELKEGVYIQTHPGAEISHRSGSVVLKIGRGIMGLTTTAAHKLAFGLIKKEREATAIGGYITMNINGAMINLLPVQAKRIGAKLIQYSDDADDFQIGVRK